MTVSKRKLKRLGIGIETTKGKSMTNKQNIRILKLVIDEEVERGKGWAKEGNNKLLEMSIRNIGWHFRVLKKTYFLSKKEKS